MNYRFLLRFSGLLGSAFLLSGCQDSSLQDRIRDILHSFSAGSSKNQPPDPVLARVGNARITLADYQRALTLLQPAAQNQVTASPVTASPNIHPEGINAMIDQKVIELSARKLGAEQDADYQRQKSSMENSLLRQWLMVHLPAVSEADLSQYYKEHQRDYQPKVQITASRIVCTSLHDAKKAQALLASGKSFADVSQEMIRLKTAYTTGSLGVLIKGQMDPQLEKPLAALRKGQVSDLIPTNPGYQLLRKDNEVQLPGRSFEQVKPQIKNILEGQKFQQYIQKQRAAEKIVIYIQSYIPPGKSTSVVISPNQP